MTNATYWKIALIGLGPRKICLLMSLPETSASTIVFVSLFSLPQSGDYLFRPGRFNWTIAWWRPTWSGRTWQFNGQSHPHQATPHQTGIRAGRVSGKGRGDACNLPACLGQWRAMISSEQIWIRGRWYAQKRDPKGDYQYLACTR